MLTDAQKRRPHQHISSATAQSYLERSFAENRTEEIAYWAAGTIVGDTLHHPVKGPPLARAMLQGIGGLFGRKKNGGLDLRWLEVLRVHPNTDIQFMLTNSGWLSEWAGRADAVTYGVDVLGLNPFHHRPNYSWSVWAGHLKLLLRDEALSTEKLAMLETWWNRHALSGPHDSQGVLETISEAMTEVLSGRSWSGDNGLKNDDHFELLRTRLAAWRDGLLAEKTVDCSKALERFVTNIHDQRGALNLSEECQPMAVEWARCLLKHGGTLSVSATSHLFLFDGGMRLAAESWASNLISPWATDSHRWSFSQSKINDTVLTGLLRQRYSAFGEKWGTPIAGTIRYLDAITDFAEANPLNRPTDATWWQSVAGELTADQRSNTAPKRTDGADRDAVESWAQISAALWRLGKQIDGEEPTSWACKKQAAEVIVGRIPLDTQGLTDWCMEMDRLLPEGAAGILGAIAVSASPGNLVMLPAVLGLSGNQSDGSVDPWVNYLREKLKDNSKMWREIVWQKTAADVGATSEIFWADQLRGMALAVGAPTFELVARMLKVGYAALPAYLAVHLDPDEAVDWGGVAVPEAVMGVTRGLQNRQWVAGMWEPWRDLLACMVRKGFPTDVLWNIGPGLVSEQEIDDVLLIGATVDGLIGALPEAQSKSWPMREHIAKLAEALQGRAVLEAEIQPETLASPGKRQKM